MIQTILSILLMVLVGPKPMLVSEYNARSVVYYRFAPNRKQRRDGFKEGVSYIIIPGENIFISEPNISFERNKPVVVN